MKKLFLIAFTVISVFSYGQNTQEKELLLHIEDNWRSEQLSFPISFAPSLAYKGFEEVRFAPGWSKEGTQDFWTYSFVWYLDTNPELTPEKISRDLEAYFDGLMNLVSQGKSKEFPSKAILSQQPDNISYQGVITIYDAFFTTNALDLQVTVEESYCTTRNKHLVLFKFTPQDFDNDIWDTLNKISYTFNCN